MKRYLAPILYLLIGGCASAAVFPSQPTEFWGFHETVPTALSLEGYTWAGTLHMCDVLRAAEVAKGKQNESQGKISVSVGLCQRITVMAGGAWWGITTGQLADAGSAVNSKDICELVRKAAQLPSLCTLVTVTPR